MQRCCFRIPLSGGSRLDHPGRSRLGRWECGDGVCRYFRVKTDPSLRTAANFIYRREGLGEIRQASCRIRLETPDSSSGLLTCWSYEGGYLLRLYYRPEAGAPSLWAELSKSSYASASFYDPVCPPAGLTALGLGFPAGGLAYPGPVQRELPPPGPGGRPVSF